MREMRDTEKPTEKWIEEKEKKSPNKFGRY